MTPLIRWLVLWPVLVVALAGVARGENPDRVIARLARTQDATRECMQRALDALRLERARTTCATCGPTDPRLGRLDLDANPATTGAIACLEALLSPPPPPR